MEKPASAFRITIIFTILAVLGVFLLPKLSVRLNPSDAVASLQVFYTWPSASPSVLERQVTTPLEAGFNTVKGIKDIQSRSSTGSGTITLAFDKNTDIDVARFETATIIRQLYKKLPEGISYPSIRVNRPDEEEVRAFLSFSIHADQSPFEIQETLKNQLEPPLSAIENIDKIEIYGANPLEYVLSYNELTLKQFGIQKAVLFQAIQNYFNRQSLGEVKSGNQYILLSLLPEKKINWHIPVASFNGRIVYLDELTKVREQEQEAQNYYRINGENAITLSVFATKNANTLVLAKRVENELTKLSKNLPESYQVTKVYDSTEYLNSELAKIYFRTVLSVLILLLFVLLASSSFRYLMIVVISLSANLGLAFLCYYIFRIEIQLYSLAGITISLGLIIDNSIVVIDHLRNQGNKNIFVAILASTLTTIGALSVIYFLDEKYRFNLLSFAQVIIINLMVSLAVAMILIPALLQKIQLKPPAKISVFNKFSDTLLQMYASLIHVFIEYKKWLIVFIIIVFGVPFFMLPKKLDQNKYWYERVYNTTIGDEFFSENVRPYIDRYLGGTLRLFSYYVFENAYYGKNEETKLMVEASMEKGATVHQMNEVFLEIENYLHSFPEIKQFTTNVYSGDYARLEVVFQDNQTQTSFPFALKNKLIVKALDWGGLSWNIYGVGNGFSSGNGVNDPINFAVQAKGYNYDELNRWSDTLKVSLENHPRIQEVQIRENSMWRRKRGSEYHFQLDKEKLALAGVSPMTVFNQLSQKSLSKFQEAAITINGKYTAVRAISNQSDDFDLWNLQNTQLGSLGMPYALKDVSSVDKVPEDENIYKENQEYIRLIDFQYTGSAKFGAKYLDEQLALLKTKLPLGYQFERKDIQYIFGQTENQSYFLLILFIISIIYFITAVLFESLTQPFAIVSVIPISFIGVFLAFYLFDFNFDQGGMASFVLLSGITVNASIFILDQFNKLRKSQPLSDKLTLYMIAFRQKIFPILLTVLSTILGFIPFVIGGQNEVFWFALAVGTIGGLIFSLIGILFFLPLFALKKIN
jgi:multidrug efflux pump subunit AcrB